jgi:hypothetical protein
MKQRGSNTKRSEGANVNRLELIGKVEIIKAVTESVMRVRDS